MQDHIISVMANDLYITKDTMKKYLRLWRKQRQQGGGIYPRLPSLARKMLDGYEAVLHPAGRP